MDQISDTRGVASGDLADITPTQPSPIKGEGFRILALWEF
jgi:hypothetical protein